MTTFFDDANRQIALLDQDLLGMDYLQAVAMIEKPIIDVVLLNTGDREFPDDLRERIIGLVATRAVYGPLGPTHDVCNYVLQTRSSAVLGGLHSAFHELASRRAKARWGRWSDSPPENLVGRDGHDKEAYSYVV
jgi:hypothetical protein